jgi:hypothetical protein
MPTVSTDTDSPLPPESSSTSPLQGAGPLHPARVNALKQKYSAIKASTRVAEQIVREVCEEYTNDLDTFVEQVEEAMEKARNTNDDIPDRWLSRMVLRLPILMYRISSLVDRAAIETEIAKAAKESVYAQAYLRSTGTIPERENEAKLYTADESAVVDLTKHVYMRLKSKLEHADALFDGIRKVMSGRDTDKNVFRKDRS